MPDPTASDIPVLTPGECDLWRSVYAASWHQPMSCQKLGHVEDADRALFAARHADRAVLALRKLAINGPSGELMTQVIR